MLANCTYRIPFNYARPDRGIVSHFKLLTRYQFFQFCIYVSALIKCLFPVGNTGESIYLFSIQKNIETDQSPFPILNKLIVEGGITPGTALKPVIKVKNHLCHREFIGNLHPDILHKMLGSIETTPRSEESMEGK